MSVSKYKKSKIDELKHKAMVLYQQGLSTRDVAKVVNRSHQWVAKAVRELSTEGELQSITG